MKLSFYDHRLRAGADPICLESESSLGLRNYDYGAITGAAEPPQKVAAPQNWASHNQFSGDFMNNGILTRNQSLKFEPFKKI